MQSNEYQQLLRQFSLVTQERNDLERKLAVSKRERDAFARDVGRLRDALRRSQAMKRVRVGERKSEAFTPVSVANVALAQALRGQEEAPEDGTGPLNRYLQRATRPPFAIQSLAPLTPLGWPVEAPPQVPVNRLTTHLSQDLAPHMLQFLPSKNISSFRGSSRTWQEAGSRFLAETRDVGPFVKLFETWLRTSRMLRREDRRLRTGGLGFEVHLTIQFDGKSDSRIPPMVSLHAPPLRGSRWRAADVIERSASLRDPEEALRYLDQRHVIPIKLNLSLSAPLNTEAERQALGLPVDLTDIKNYNWTMVDAKDQPLSHAWLPALLKPYFVMYDGLRGEVIMEFQWGLSPAGQPVTSKGPGAN
jgi:hypothetical protein